MSVQFDATVRSRQAAPTGASGPQAPAQNPAAAAWSVDLFPSRPRSLDDLEAGAPGGSLPTSLDPEPTGGATNRGVLLRDGDAGGSVRQLQQLLRARGLDPGGVDGVFGPRTEAAVRALQHRHGLAVDGIVGPRTWALLSPGSAPPPVADARVTPPSDSSGLRARLMGAVNNRHKGVPRACFRYAWTMVAQAGGRSLGASSVSRVGRWQPIQHLDHLVQSGQVRLGDVIYVNRKPGADPSSTNLAYGPHWFVYVGNGQYADQYGIRSAAAMAAFVPGRKIDEIFRTFG
ncbi:MAG: peptidoglycan-binding domain-containing protein [Candidatus Sericytochromatia bacterium]|nr:peptidoglycan-binding domain-containing protein [Candidatus Sericytochromatia bacterium]